MIPLLRRYFPGKVAPIGDANLKKEKREAVITLTGYGGGLRNT
jgi:hypothetical protein